MKPSEANKILTTQLGPFMSEHGFATKKYAAGNPLFSKLNSDGTYVLLLCLHNQRQWEPMQGSHFYMKFAVNKADDFAGSPEQPPLSFFLGEKQLAEAFELQKKVIDKVFRIEPPTEFDKQMQEMAQMILQSELKRGFRSKSEVRYRYLDADDLVNWCAFFRTVLPAAITKLEQGAQSTGASL